MILGKHNCVVRDFETFRILAAEENFELLNDFTDSLSEDALVGMEESVLEFMELKAQKYEEQIDIKSLSFKDKALSKLILDVICGLLSDRDLILILSGKTDWQLFEELLPIVKRHKTDEVDIFLCVINREDQETFRYTCGIY